MIKVSVVGVGNCVSSLVQGLAYCRHAGAAAVGVPFPLIGPYAPTDIEIVSAFDIDERKVGEDLADAIFAAPNCTTKFWPDVPKTGVVVQRGPTLDGVSAALQVSSDQIGFLVSDHRELSEDDVVAAMADVDVVLNFLPVGSQKATEFYAACAIKADAAFVNGIPVFIASDPKWAARFANARLPVLGDDFKAQFGATIVHRALVHLFDLRGAKLDRTYQLNVGGNTDFLNMMDPDRLSSKRISKTESVQTAANARLDENKIRVGPSDYVAWLHDRKVAYIRMEGRLFGGVPVNLEARLDVEDSPNAAAMALAAIRLARISLDRGLAGAIQDACAFLFKHPPCPLEDAEAHDTLLRFASAPK